MNTKHLGINRGPPDLSMGTYVLIVKPHKLANREVIFIDTFTRSERVGILLRMLEDWEGSNIPYFPQFTMICLLLLFTDCRTQMPPPLSTEQMFHVAHIHR